MLEKDHWYRRLLASLEQKGFEMGDGIQRGKIYTYRRKGMLIEILESHTVRVIKQDGRVFTHRNLRMAALVLTVTAAVIDGDCPD